MGSHVKPGEPAIAQSRNSVAQNGDAQEDEVYLVRLARKDAYAGLALKDIDARDEEESRAEVDGQGNGDVSNDIQPAADPAGYAPPVGGSEHEGLVVDTWKWLIGVLDVSTARGSRNGMEWMS